MLHFPLQLNNPDLLITKSNFLIKLNKIIKINLLFSFFLIKIKENNEFEKFK